MYSHNFHSKFLLGLSGKAGVGKTTLANIIVKKLAEKGVSSKRVSFGDKLREEVCALYGVTMDECTSQVEKAKCRPVDILVDGFIEIPFVGCICGGNIVKRGLATIHGTHIICQQWVERGYWTLREALQYYAQDVAREHDKDYFVKTLDKSIKGMEEEIIVIDDIRQENEVEYVTKKGVCWRVHPNESWTSPCDPSYKTETSLDSFNFMRFAISTRYGELDSTSEIIIGDMPIQLEKHGLGHIAHILRKL